MAMAIDDDVFGEFTFASNSNPQSKDDGDDEDEWSDFVKSPQQQSSASWIKPSGALPLSIFGEEDGGEDNSNNFSKSYNGDASVNSRVGSSATSVDSRLNHVSLNKNASSTDAIVDAREYNRFENAGSGSSESIFSWNGSLGQKSPNVMMKGKDSDMESGKRPVESDIDDGGWDFKGGSLDGMNQNFDQFSKDLAAGGKERQSRDGDDHDSNDDDGWEFKAANMDFESNGVNDGDVEFTDHQSFRTNGPSSGNEAVENTNRSLDLFATSDLSTDFFANTGGTLSSISKQVDLFGPEPTTEAINGFVSDVTENIPINNGDHMWNHNADVSAEFDDDFGDFTSAASDNGPKPAEVPVVDDHSPTPAGQLQGKDKKSSDPLRLSIFGIDEPQDEPENVDLSDIQDSLSNQSNSDRRKSHTTSKVVSINDLISSLYNQSGQISGTDTTQTLNKTQSNFSNGVSDSKLANVSDYLEDDSWDFKDAIQTKFDNMNTSVIDKHPSISSKLKLSNHLDFYLKLKEELWAVAKCRIEGLQASNDTASDKGVSTLDDELQLICKELEQFNLDFQERNPSDHPSWESFASDIIEVLKEPQFQILESEYNLSEKLLVANKDLRSAIELLRHAITMTKILTMATSEEQKTCITTWHDMMLACAKELRHGSSIWNQAVEKHIQSLLLSEPQGTRFILALGEIYKVVVMLGASAKLFKLWILSGSIGLPDFYSVLDECHAIWSTSGLEEALSNVSTPTALDNASVLKSIKEILNLDALALQNLVFTKEGSICQISGLRARVVPDMKMITWEKEQYFVTLANLWANLISCDPLKLPKLNLG